MKYFLLVIALIISAGICYSVFSHKPYVSLSETHDAEYNNVECLSLSHNDSIDEFIDWYAAMTDTFCSLTELEDFKLIGPKKNKELEERFANWRVLLTDIDKDKISTCFKNSMQKLIPHSCNIMLKNGQLDKPISHEQIDLMIEMGERGVDVVMDTTTRLDYFVRWTVNNYNPPTE